MIVFKRVLATVLCTLIAFPPQSFAAMFGGTDDALPSNVDPQVEAFTQDVENGNLRKRPAKDADIFHLTNQEIEIFENGRTLHYDLNEHQVEIPHVAFTEMKIVYDAEKRSLYFDAYRGVDQNGNNGLLVARQTLNGIDLVASAKDVELFQFVDSKMQMHAIDLGLVATEIFKSPIPVFQKLWVPDAQSIEQWAGQGKNVQWKGKLKAGFLTRGTAPMNLSRAVLTPHTNEGDVKLTAGDFYIASESAPGTESFAYAIFSRDTTYSQIIRAYKIIQWQAAILSTNTKIQADIETVVEGLQKEIDKQEIELMRESISPVARVVMSSLDKKSVAALKTREGSVSALKTNAVDTFSAREWLQTYTEVSKNAPETTDDRTKEELWFKFVNKLNGDQRAAEAQAIKDKSDQPSLRQRLKTMRNNTLQSPSYQPIAIALSVSVGLLGTTPLAPFLVDQFEAIQQLKVVAWAYENYYPEVLKDGAYRWPLIYSMISLAAIWPEAVAFSIVTGKVLRGMAEKMKTETSRKAIYIKDLARNWGSLNNWQRITSFGMRLYSWMILPYWRVAIQYFAQQKAFFSATNNDLNPFDKIKMDSDVGRKLGLTRDQYIGLNRTFGEWIGNGNKTEKLGDRKQVADKREQIAENLRIQSALVTENKKLDALALLVAATLVAEKHKMDPALLLLLGKEGVENLDLTRVSQVLDSPEKRQEWQMLTHTLMDQMSRIKKGSIIVDQHMSELIAQYFASGEKLAAKIDGMSSLKKRILRFRIAFASQMSDKTKALANFGLADHVFLKRVYTNEFVSGQVQKEFTVDHMMVVGIIGLYGERADLSHPEHLAADPNGFLWTSRAHWYDIFLNTFSHFFIAGAQTALVFQKMKPRIAANYAPIEDYVYETKTRAQGVISGGKDWLQVLNLEKSDLGGIIIKRFLKRFTTMTAGITMMLALRVGVFHQPLHEAVMAWGLMFVAGQWFYGWIWDPVQRGNEMEGEHLEQMAEKLKVARREISRGDFEKGRADLTALYQRYNPKVLKVFQLENMSKPELLSLSVDHPPIYTQSNRWIAWMSTTTAAVLSTVLAIPLSVILMDSKLLTAPETWYKWIPISIGLYTASYFLSSDKIKKYKSVYGLVKEKWDSKVDPIKLKLINDSLDRIEKADARKVEKEAAAVAKAELAAANAALTLAKKEAAAAQPKVSLSEQFANAKNRVSKATTTFLAGGSCQDLFKPATQPSLRPTFR